MPALLLGQPPGPTESVLLVCGCMLLAAWWWSLDRQPTDEEARVNYHVEPGRCGRCGYELAGNVSGVCPECGWRIPPESSLPVDPTWGLFWKRWEIVRMDRPRRRLAVCLGAAAGATAMGLVPLMVMRRPSLPVVLGAACFFLMAVFGLINGWRILRFIRHSSGDSRPRAGQEAGGGDPVPGASRLQ